MSQFIAFMLTEAELAFRNAETFVPVEAGLNPSVQPLSGLIRLDEKLQLHLLELTGAEEEVAGGDLVSERLADLSDTEGEFHPGSSLSIKKVDENSLSRLRS